MNKNELPFLAIDYRILALDIKAAINEKTIDSSTILKLKLVYYLSHRVLQNLRGGLSRTNKNR